MKYFVAILVLVACHQVLFEKFCLIFIYFHKSFIFESIQTFADMPMMNPDTQKPYTPEEVIAAYEADGTPVDYNEVYSIYGKNKFLTGPIDISAFQPGPKKMPSRPFDHVCNVKQALKNAPKLKKNLPAKK